MSQVRILPGAPFSFVQKYHLYLFYLNLASYSFGLSVLTSTTVSIIGLYSYIFSFGFHSILSEFVYNITW